MDLNESKRVIMDPKLIQMAGNKSHWIPIDSTESQTMLMDLNESQRIQMDRMGSKLI